MENGQTVEKVASAGHTFFPASWDADKVMKAGAWLFENGSKKRGGTVVSGTFDGVKMTGFLEKIGAGEYTPSTFFPVGR